MSGQLRIVIVGGVAAGMSAATRARRMNENASIIVLERGGHISFANCGLPYYLSGQIKAEQKLLVTTPEKVRERFNIDARVGHEVIGISRAAKTVDVRVVATGQSLVIPYDKLILATGAAPIIPPIDHVDAPNVFLLRSIEDTQSMLLPRRFILAERWTIWRSLTWPMRRSSQAPRIRSIRRRWLRRISDRRSCRRSQAASLMASRLWMSERRWNLPGARCRGR